MNSKMKKSPKRIIAFLVAILMVLSVFPVGLIKDAFASVKPVFTVQLSEEISGATVTITDETNPQNVYTQNTLLGLANFADVLDDQSLYSITITGAVGYNDYNIANVNISELSSYTATLIAMDKVLVFGTVYKEDTGEYAGTTVSLTGYDTGSIKTNESGYFEIEVYKGQAYSMSITAEDKYKVENLNINASTDYSIGEINLKINTYLVTTSGGVGGDISASETLRYGKNKDINMVSLIGYEIESLTVGGTLITEAAGHESYTYYLTNITSDVTISAIFIRKAYDITITYGEDGMVKNEAGQEVTDDIGTLGGIIRVQYGEDTSFNVIPKSNYHVGSVKVDGNTIDLESDTNITALPDGTYTYKLSNVTRSYSVKVTFEIDRFDITVSRTGEGSIKVDNSNAQSTETVDYGSNLKFTISPSSSLYYVNEIKVDETAIMLEDLNIVGNEDGSYTYTLPAISSDHSIEVSFEEVPTTIGVEDTYYIMNDALDSLRTKYEESDGTRVRVYANNGVVEFTGNAPYSTFKLDYDDGYSSAFKATVVVSRTKTITGITVKRSTGLFLNSTQKVMMKKIKIIIEQTKPTVDIISKSPLDDWTKEPIVIKGKASDEGGSGLFQVRYSTSLEGFKEDTYVKDPLSENKVSEAFLSEGEYSFGVSNATESNLIYYVWAYDIAGNKSESYKSIKVTIDITAPKVDSIAKSPDTEWTKKSITISGTASDQGGANLCEIHYSNSLADYTNDSYTNNNVLKATLNNGAYEFTVPNSDEHYDTYYVWAYDNAGNKSTAYKTITVYIDTTLPTVDSVIKANSSDWIDGINGGVAITANVSDGSSNNNSGIAGIRYSTEDNYQTATEVIGTKSSFSFNTPVDEEGKAKEFEGTYYIWVFDLVGNISEVKTIDVKIDTKNPTVSEFEITPKNKSIPAKIINFLTFGTYFNEFVEVTVKATDEDISSGIKNITLYGDNVEIETKNVTTENTATFELSAPSNEVFNKILTAITTDNVGHKSEATLATTTNSNIKDSKLMLEAKLPQITITPSTNPYTDGEGKLFYKSDVAFDIVASDTDSGINKVEIKINGKEIKTDKNKKVINDNFYESKTLSESFVVSTDQGIISTDSFYTIEVNATDNAGNVYPYSKTVYKDTTNPDITDFEFTNNSDNEADGAPVEITDYGFFFVNNTTVSITSKDDGSASGVKSITYYTVDYTNSTSGVKSDEVTKAVDSDNKISFIVPSNFKGQIYAKPTDNVNNTPSIYVKPKGAILENSEKHIETSEITLDVPETSYTDNNGINLYENNVDVDITVADSYSGIKTIEWMAISEYDTANNQSGIINIDNSGKMPEDTDGWNKTNTDINLVTEMKKSITVSNDSNTIKVYVKLTDRAGNTSEKEITFSIDKIAPTMQVTYDNNDYDTNFAGETEFYKANRTATVVVTERNFKPDDSKIIIANADGVIPSVSGWTETKNSTNPDKTTYTATIDYTEDGDYTFDINVMDLASNLAEKFAIHTFTIDKTNPVISVLFDNNSAMNQNYYNAERTATITITEHNFETSRITVTGIATDDGAASTYPAVSEWTTSGDVHTATINYSNDGLYTFDVAYIDKSGNIAEDFAEETFYVDKTAPTLVISGVADKSANNGEVVPVITYSDTNFDKDNVMITLTGANRGTLNIDGIYSEVTNGQVFTFKNFESIQEVDDIYTLTTTIVDKAGKETKESITFSVNRFGSVYSFDDTLKAIQSKYVQNETDVIITETNVDSLGNDTIKIKVTKNGTPSDLAEGTDYNIVKSGGDGQWSQYKYIINSKVFQNDSKYIVALYSVDAAGNINENIDESKEAEVWFGVDKTSPVIVPIDLEDGKTYSVDNKNITVSISDNLVLNNAKIYLNDEEKNYNVNGEDYTFNIDSLNSSQKVKIVAVDAAGNEFVKEIGGFYVTTNIFVNWYTNTPLFVGTLFGLGILGIGVATFALFRKKA